MHRWAFPIAAFLAAGPVLAQATPAAPAPPAAAKVTDRNHPDYMRCRAESVIGSHAKVRKVCLTNRQWANVERDSKRLAGRMIEENQGVPPSN